MKVLIGVLILTLSVSAMTKECEVATIKATKVHVAWMNGDATLTESYNAENYMKKVCKG